MPTGTSIATARNRRRLRVSPQHGRARGSENLRRLATSSFHPVAPPVASGPLAAFDQIAAVAAENVMARRKRIALIAHDNRKLDLLDWARYNSGSLRQHELFATGTTGTLLATEIDLDITTFRSGPLGGDQQVGARIAEGKIDFVIFFWDPLEPHPHDVDVKALLRIAVVYNIPIACNRATADFLISSPLLTQPYARSMNGLPALVGGQEA